MKRCDCRRAAQPRRGVHAASVRMEDREAAPPVLMLSQVYDGLSERILTAFDTPALAR